MKQKSETRLLQQLTPQNLLSFGPAMSPLALESLNLLIGPNGSGKSNLLEAIALLRATAGDLRQVVSRGGGVREWIWKGDPQRDAVFEALVAYPERPQPLRHRLAFGAEQHRLHLVDEQIEPAIPEPAQGEPAFYYRYQAGQPLLQVAGGETRRLVGESVASDASILSQRRDPEGYPEITYLATVYERIRIYREWAFGRDTIFREPQKADLRNDRLAEDFSNLGLFLNRLRRNPKAKTAILTALRDLYDGISDFDVSIEGGTVQVFLTEGDFVIPATRLSDGTLRYLCLLAILCDPEPPPLICIEEPELGLHPDILPKVADLLIAAANRTQLIVTTHSDLLVDAMSERPSAVVVCEKHDGQTEMQRLDPTTLAAWLTKYRLGQLWTRGQLGGTRW